MNKKYIDNLIFSTAKQSGILSECRPLEGLSNFNYYLKFVEVDKEHLELNLQHLLNLQGSVLQNDNHPAVSTFWNSGQPSSLLKNQAFLLKVLNLNPITQKSNQAYYINSLASKHLTPHLLVSMFPSFYLFRFEEGTTYSSLSEEQKNNPNLLLALIDKLYQLHTTEEAKDQVPHLLTPIEGAEKLLLILQSRIENEDLPRNVTEKLQHELTKKKQHSEDFLLTQGLAHNDLNPNNIIVDFSCKATNDTNTPGPLKTFFIDFEYASWGDIFFDLISARRWLPGEYFRQLINLYKGSLLAPLSDKQIEAKLELFSTIGPLVDCVWYLYMYFFSNLPDVLNCTQCSDLEGKLKQTYKAMFLALYRTL